MTVDLQGLIACSRYSFAPNSLHYCGPERQTDMLDYVASGEGDRGLTEILNRFDTLYKYLVFIASENNIHDPFDRRVVEAYWLGNNLLHNVKTAALGHHLAEGLELKKKVPKKMFTPIMDTVISGVPQHNFHVLNIFIRTGHTAVPHTLSTMDHCRISWGRVMGEVGSGKGEVGSKIQTKKQYVVETQPLIYEQEKLVLGDLTKKIVTSVAAKPKIGEWVSIHWGYICDVLTPIQRKNLAYYTQVALRSANKARPSK